MSNRIKTVPSRIFAAFLASVVSTAIACIAARAADDCLSEPKPQTRPGGHWYYRIDSSNHRKCWYLGEGQQVSQSKSPRPFSSSSPPPPRQTAAAIQTTLADAHAELPMVTTPTEPLQWFSPATMSNPEKIIDVVGDASPSETPSPPSARDLSETRVIDGQATTQSRTELLPGADREPVAELTAEETTADPLRIRLALLLIVLGLSTIGGCLIFRLSAGVQASRAVTMTQLTRTEH
jgi:hypothetical protein